MSVKDINEWKMSFNPSKTELTKQTQVPVNWLTLHTATKFMSRY